MHISAYSLYVPPSESFCVLTEVCFDQDYFQCKGLDRVKGCRPLNLQRLDQYGYKYHRNPNYPLTDLSPVPTETMLTIWFRTQILDYAWVLGMFPQTVIRHRQRAWTSESGHIQTRRSTHNTLTFNRFSPQQIRRTAFS